MTKVKLWAKGFLLLFCFCIRDVVARMLSEVLQFVVATKLGSNLEWNDLE